MGYDGLNNQLYIVQARLKLFTEKAKRKWGNL
jgi:hypothetical protein